MIVAEDFYRTPFASQNQFRQTVSIQIAEDRATHQANVSQTPGVFHIGREFPTCASKDQRGSRFWITSRHHSPTDKQVESAISNDIGHSQVAGARLLARQSL